MKPIWHLRSAVLAVVLTVGGVSLVHAGPCYRGGWGGVCYRGGYYRGGYCGGGWGGPVVVGGGAVVVGAALSTPYYYPYGYTYAVPATTIYTSPQTVVQQPDPPQPAAPTNQLLEMAQTKLAGLGYFKGSADGIYGAQTSNAVVQFQSDNNLSISGRLDLKTLASLGITP